MKGLDSVRENVREGATHLSCKKIKNALLNGGISALGAINNQAITAFKRFSCENYTFGDPKF